MREIKFRVWNGFRMEPDIMAGRFGTFYVNPGAKGDGIDEKDSACLTPFNTKMSGDAKVMQFTGAKDKNGIEIYEDDFVKAGNDVMRVVWSEKHASFALGKAEWAFLHFFAEAVEAHRCEVVGNVYQNPEMSHV